MYQEMEPKTIDNTPVADIDYPSAIDVENDAAGQPVGISLDEWIGLLDRKLIAHYGEEFRYLLNKARADRG